MQATTVRVDATTKRELDRLQGLIQMEAGERLSHNDLLKRLLAVARRHEAELFQQDETWRPPTAEQYARLTALVVHWGVPSDARHVDDVLYGGDGS